MKILFLLVVALQSFANWTKTPSSEFSLSPPPEKGSEAYKQDFIQLKKYQDSRGEKECNLAAHQEHPTFSAFFGQTNLLTEDEKKATKDLVTKVMKLTERVSGYQKDKFRRPRPYDVDVSLEPCAKKPGGSKSYPSSHAASAAAAACVLGSIVEEKKPKLAEWGDYLGELRVIVGVHHPSDVNAGRSLGRAVCEYLAGLADFQKELDAVKKQIAKP